VVTIFLPPLKDRNEDIPVLVNFFTKKYCRENNKPLMKVSPAAMNALISYPWPGNIRELKNVINSAIVFTRSDTLLPEDFEPLLYGKNSGDDISGNMSSQDCYAMLRPLFESIAFNNDGRVFDNFIAEVEAALFRLTMEKHKNNEVHAAKFLGISRNTLRQRLKAYKLS
jgi:DNA-binding NtrC family response regulator